MKLYDFQIDARNAVLSKLKQTNAVLLQSATASGKTVIAASLTSEHLKEDFHNKVLVLVNLQVLVGQTSDTLLALGVDNAVLHDEITETKNGRKLEFKPSRTILTMPETLINTILGKNDLIWDSSFVPTLIIIDEAHKGTSSRYQQIRDMFPNAKIVGLTATPYRDQNEEGEHLTEWYKDNLITTISIQDLIKIGRLVQPKYHSIDYNEEQLIEVWKKYTTGHKNKQTIIFTQDTQHSLKLNEVFQKAGIKSQIVTSGSDVGEQYVTKQTVKQRNKIYKQFEDEELTVLISVVALCEGFDAPTLNFVFYQDQSAMLPYYTK